MDRFEQRAMAMPHRPFVIAALFLGALALRPQLAGVGPLIPEIQTAFGLSHAAAGLLVTIPIVCMGLFALPAARLFAALGARRATTAALALVAVAGLLRTASIDVTSLLGLTVLFGIGAGLAGALLPAVVRETVADAPALATGFYAIGINGGAGIAAGLAPLLALYLGGWRGALLAFAAAAVASCVAWVLLSRGQIADRPIETGDARLPLRNAGAWSLAIIFGLQGLCFHGLNAWLADVYIERDWSAVDAGWLVAGLNLVTLPATLLVAVIGDRVSRQHHLLLSALLLLVSLGGLSLFPADAWLWTVGAAIACGSLFPLTLTLCVEISDSGHEAGAIAGLMLGVGYLISALAPVALGATRDVTGSFADGLWLLTAVALALVVACWTFARQSARMRAK